MTATHPPVAPLKPVRADRPSVRVPAAEAKVARAIAIAPDAVAPDAVAPDAAAQAAATTRTTLHWLLIAARILGAAALLLVAYVAISDNWVASAADALVGWYTETIAPYMAIDLTITEAPTVDSGVFGPVDQPPVASAD